MDLVYDIFVTLLDLFLTVYFHALRSGTQPFALISVATTLAEVDQALVEVEKVVVGEVHLEGGVEEGHLGVGEEGELQDLRNAEDLLPVE